MNRIKIGLLVLTGFVGVTSGANLELEATYTLHPDTPMTSYNAAIDHFDHFTGSTFFNPIDRVSGESIGEVTSGEFRIVFNPNKSTTITWNFTSRDDFFLGVFVTGNANRGNLYENIIELEDEDFRGTATVDAPRNSDGTSANISHLDFFAARAAPVADSGSSLLLLGGALGALRLCRPGMKAPAIV